MYNYVHCWGPGGSGPGVSYATPPRDIGRQARQARQTRQARQARQAHAGRQGIRGGKGSGAARLRDYSALRGRACSTPPPQKLRACVVGGEYYKYRIRLGYKRTGPHGLKNLKISHPLDKSHALIDNIPTAAQTELLRLEEEYNMVNENESAPISSLMAELEGVDQKITKITEPEKPPVQAVDPLDVKPAASITPRDAKGYRVAVRGEYYAFAPGGSREKVKKPFNAAFNLPALEGALGVIRGRLLDKYLAKKYTDFVTARICAIVNVTPLSEATPESTNLRYMPAERLRRYIDDHNVPVVPENYASTEEGIAQLRASVIDYVQNPAGFAERETRRVDKMKGDDALAKLNPDIV